MQVADFAKGIELDSWIEKIYLESGGGGGNHESYELMAAYLSQAEFRKDAEPIVLFIADERMYNYVEEDEAKIYGIKNFGRDVNGFDQLRKTFKDNVYVFLNKYEGDYNFKEWNAVLPAEHTIKIKEEKAIVDLMLGVLALIGKKSLKTYALDMGARGQDTKRITGVTAALEGLSKALVPIENINKHLPVSTNAKKSSTKNNRL